jgi:hypothetical protein
MSRTPIFGRYLSKLFHNNKNTLLENIKNANLTSAHLRLFELNLSHK